MNITTNSGGLYTLNVYLDALDMPVAKAPTMCDFKLSLIAPDTNIYDNSAGGALSATVSKQTTGGITWPIHWPITWSGASSPTIVTNTGSVTIYPKITLTGAMTNPTITNSTAGQSFALTGFTTGTSDVVTIDMLNRAVLLNGGSVLQYMTSGSSWWPLLVGNNSITLSTTGGSDNVSASITWQAAYRGI
jgi:hypothetical protein